MLITQKDIDRELDIVLQNLSNGTYYYAETKNGNRYVFRFDHINGKVIYASQYFEVSPYKSVIEPTDNLVFSLTKLVYTSHISYIRLANLQEYSCLFYNGQYIKNSKIKYKSKLKSYKLNFKL